MEQHKNEINLKCKNKLSHTIICFFDEKLTERFRFLVNSIDEVYSDYKIKAFVNFEIEKNNFDFANYENIEFLRINDENFSSFSKESTSWHIDSIMSYGRLFPNMFDQLNMNEKYLYLDVDIIINNEINEFYLNSNKNFVFSILDNLKNVENAKKIEQLKNWRKQLHLKKLGEKYGDFFKTTQIIDRLIEKGKYFNSGVIVINDVEKYLSLLNKIFRFENKLISGNFSDQDLLNVFLEDEIEIVYDSKMNWMPVIETPFSGEESILHFAGKNKFKKLLDMIGSYPEEKEKIIRTFLNIQKNIYSGIYDFNERTSPDEIKLEHTIICFFDEKRIESFKMLYFSICNIYHDFKIIAYIDFDMALIRDYIYPDKRITFKNISNEIMNKFDVNVTPWHINSKMSYGRLMLEQEMSNYKKFIYLDVDILLAKPFIIKYLNSNENFVFKIATSNDDEDEVWNNLKSFREAIHKKNFIEGKDFYIKNTKILSEKLDKKNYFNSGVIIINNINSYLKLINKIINDKFESFKHFSDQDLLNLFNENELTLIEDTRMNKMFYLANKFESEIVVYHFAGDSVQKNEMKKMHEMNMDFIKFYESINNKTTQQDTYKKIIKEKK